jgi:Bacterial Ig-like domain (group 3)
MVLQRDKGSAPPEFDTGLPRSQSSDDVPRWLVVLGIVAACTLLVALLRYAIDLLGVVFLIILVGFSFRAVSDWLTEGESVSAWALGAVLAGLFGTMLVGSWLFGLRDVTTGPLEQGVPSPVLAVADWLEVHGWGQRVLLGGGGGPTAPSTPGMSAPPMSASAPALSGGLAAPRAEPESPSGPASRAVASESSSPGSRAPSRVGGGEAEAATASPSPSPSGPPQPRPQEPAGGGTEPASPPPVSEPVSQPAVEAAAIDTTISLASSHSTSVVGTSVRFTATVAADGSGVPSGVVVFFDGDRAIGTAAVHGAGPSVTAVLATLGLAIGDHPITAEFHGAHGFLGSRSPTISQTITRR